MLDVRHFEVPRAASSLRMPPSTHEPRQSGPRRFQRFLNAAVPASAPVLCILALIGHEVPKTHFPKRNDRNPGVKHSEEDNNLGEQTMREPMATLYLPKCVAELLTAEGLKYE
jgi:hypothetical protein